MRDRRENVRVEWISNEVLLFITGTYIPPLGTDQDGR